MNTMKFRMLFGVAAALACMLFASCAKDVIDLTGSIKGIVKDANDGHFIENCLVSLTPGGVSQTTTQSGVFEFTGLTPGEYTLSFAKTGYPNTSKTVTVVTGGETNSDVLLKANSPFALSDETLNFGDLETDKSFYVANNTDAECSYTISNIPEWLTFSKTKGAIGATAQAAISAKIDRNKVDYGSFSHNVIISYSGRTTGQVFLSVKFDKVILTIPEVTIASDGENIAETSFDIKGNLVATGGSQVLNHGHCWSTSKNPTINDYRTELGMRKEVGTFMSSITGLTTYTTYYVRAYAENAQGISYSDEIVVTTQDAYSDKWDGNIATGYAGGRGTIVNPYIIKTGGQLLYAFKQGKGYLKLANNIDLNNHNWKPYSFNGTFDGDGHTISNLYINRDNEPCGLVKSFGGEISNLTIRGINIKSTYDDTGAIAGSGGTLSNCHLVLTSGSKIEGCEYVGGLIGYGSHTKITNCSVTSLDSETYIYGTKYVGGICGRSVEATDCHVSCNIYGGSCVGGIVGIYGSVEDCFFQGNINGETEVGGIMGFADNSKIIACKVVANIEGEGYVGGICGWGGSQNGNITIIACYSDGHISSSYGILGKSPLYGDIILQLSYTTMQSEHYSKLSLTPGSKGDSFSIYDSNNITQDLKEAYSDYASYWNFDNQWTWSGTVNGQTKQVKCPRLAWE